MRKSSVTLLVAAIAMAASQASAADLPRKAPAYVPPPPPPLTWTGCYIGANVGGIRGRFELEGPFGGEASRTGDWGFAGGLQIGCDYQFAGTGFVVGFRNMFDGTTNNRERNFTIDAAALGTATGTVEFHNRWFDALTGRIGYSWGPGLLYFQGGAVWSRVEADITVATTPIGPAPLTTVTTGSFSDTKTGWTVGLGGEYRFAPNWSVFLEGNYYDFGSRDRVVFTPVATACVAGCLFSGKTTAASVLVGVNYRFTGL
ncbi:MAG TPA: outer membrane beta-barrel protein [Pseudolabrys sp.]|jgi:outer membrane immunogenic protein|nr:outer membrane beta-barrel protein [Pseudolabrys sp.]